MFIELSPLEIKGFLPNLDLFVNFMDKRMRKYPKTPWCAILGMIDQCFGSCTRLTLTLHQAYLTFISYSDQNKPFLEMDFSVVCAMRFLCIFKLIVLIVDFV